MHQYEVADPVGLRRTNIDGMATVKAHSQDVTILWFAVHLCPLRIEGDIRYS